MKKKMGKSGTLVTAILWTISTLLWTATTVLRFSDPWRDSASLGLTLVALLFTLLACVLFWIRFALFDKK